MAKRLKVYKVLRKVGDVLQSVMVPDRVALTYEAGKRTVPCSGTPVMAFSNKTNAKTFRRYVAEDRGIDPASIEIYECDYVPFVPDDTKWHLIHYSEVPEALSRGFARYKPSLKCNTLPAGTVLCESVVVRERVSLRGRWI